MYTRQIPLSRGLFAKILTTTVPGRRSCYEIYVGGIKTQRSFNDVNVCIYIYIYVFTKVFRRFERNFDYKRAGEVKVMTYFMNNETRSLSCGPTTSCSRCFDRSAVSICVKRFQSETTVVLCANSTFRWRTTVVFRSEKGHRDYFAYNRRALVVTVIVWCLSRP